MARIGFISDRLMLFQEGLSAAIEALGHTHMNIQPSEFNQSINEKLDLLIIDLDQHHYSILKELKKLHMYGIELLVFANSFDQFKIDFILRCNVKGILTKDVSIEMLSNCLRSLINHEAYIHPSLSKYLISSYLDEQPQLKRKGNQKQLHIVLSEREKEVLRQILQGKTDREVGEALSISRTTVRNHIQNVYKKTNTKNRIQLLLLCLENQWL